MDRSYYHCPDCRSGQWPWDQTLGLGQRRQTPAVMQLVSLAATLTSFDQAAKRMLPKLCGLRFSKSTVRRTAEDAGERLGKLLEQGETFGDARPWSWQRDAAGRRCAYASLDHTGIPQQAAGGGKAEGRMAAVGMIYNPDSEHDPQEPPPHQMRYLSGLYDLDELSLQLRRQAAQVGWDDAEQQIVLSDGGSGLEQFAQRTFPLAGRILDFWHASEHLSELARALHPEDQAVENPVINDHETENQAAENPSAFEEQLHQWCQLLKHEGGGAMVAQLEALDVRGHSAAVQEVHRQQLGYFRNHAGRMNYPTYVANGWRIGSGPVEAACKHVASRLKCSGMRWRPFGTDSISHLRALYRSEPGQWESFWQAHAI